MDTQLAQTGVEEAVAEIEALLTDTTVGTPRHNGLLHALRVIRTFPDVRQSLRQLDGHAEFAAEKAKRNAYAEASAILARHTGETPLPKAGAELALL